MLSNTLRWFCLTMLGIWSFQPTAPVFGWGDKGHITVATIAEGHLSQAAKKGVFDILGSQRLSDPRTAVWADHIRVLNSYKLKYMHNDQWHFIDTEYAKERIDLVRDGKDGNNVVAKIADFQAIISDKAQPMDRRREALLFIVHFVGDMHQPLHCIDRNDRGGNGIEILINGQHQRETNLHGFWDTTLVAMGMGAA